MSIPHLKNPDKFRKILEHYRPSPEAIDCLHKSKFVVMAGPVASGRGTLIRELAKSGQYKIIASDTTRPPRVNDGILEQNGREYWFISEKQFLEGLANGDYIEAAVIHNQQVSGMSVREIMAATQEDKIAINDIEPQGVDNLKTACSSVIAIFVLPPSFDEWMKRLDGRGHMTEVEKRRRLESADLEIRRSLNRNYYKYVINDDLHSTVKLLNDRIINGTFDESEQQLAKQHAQNLLVSINDALYPKNPSDV